MSLVPYSRATLLLWELNILPQESGTIQFLGCRPELLHIRNQMRMCCISREHRILHFRKMLEVYRKAQNPSMMRTCKEVRLEVKVLLLESACHLGSQAEGSLPVRHLL